MATDLPSNTRALLARSAFAPELSEFPLCQYDLRHLPLII